mgnify:CR=1 FL=1|jgi:hypothetical protein
MKEYQLKVDSTKISIPLDECTVINKDLTDLISRSEINTVTGEQLKEKFTVGSAHIRDNKNTDGTYFKIFLEPSQFVYVNGVKQNKPFITILINSKLNTDKYFNGITKDNFREFYDIIMNENVFSCSFDTFKNARYNDTDICFDFHSTIPKFNALKTNLIRSAINPSLFHQVTKKDNNGIWTPTKSEPRKQATPKKPFVKFYSKQIDMEGQSYNFAQAYLKPSQYNDVYRCEVTVKNVAHKKRLGIEHVKTIWEFLNQDLHSIVISITNEYFVKQKLIKATGLTPSNYIMLNLINLSISKGANRSEIIKAFDLNQNGCSKKSRHNAKEQYHKIMSSDDVNKEVLDNNETTKDVMKFLGIDKSDSIG